MDLSGAVEMGHPSERKQTRISYNISLVRQRLRRKRPNCYLSRRSVDFTALAGPAPEHFTP